MARDDILDPERARFYLWGAGGAADTQEAEAQPVGAATRGDVLSVREFVALVQRVWAISDGGLQARATIGLAEHAERLGLQLVAMPPHEGVQLLRLVVRHRLFLEPDLYKQLPGALMWLSFESRELLDLLVEVAESGDSRLAFLITLGMGHSPSAMPGLGLRLLPTLAAQGHFRKRELAARFAGWAQDWPEVVPELRRALREPCLRLRVVALRGLLAKGGLRKEDVQALLEDSVVHPPLDQRTDLSDACYNYGRALHEAIVQLRPPEGYRPLLAIIRNHCVFVHGWRALGESFALTALAAAYPQHALSEIDRNLESSLVWDRRQAVTAAAELADELAQPRLLRGAGDPDARVHEYAREIWFKRFGRDPCAEPELPIEFDRGVASESLVVRLTVLRGKDQTARLTMVKALMAAAPECEALALLLYALRDNTPWTCGGNVDLPRSCEAWASELCRCFGERAFDGLMVLAERQSRAGIEHGWLNALASLPMELLGARQLDSLRSLAERVFLGSSPGNRCTDPILALRAVGAPGSCFDRLWRIALELPDATEDDGAWNNWNYAVYGAKEALGHAGPSPELDARIVRELSTALDRYDFEFAARLVQIGAARKDAPEFVALTERALELCAGELALRSNGAASNLAARCLESLQARGALPLGRLLGWLEHPEEPLFMAALRQVTMGSDWAVPALLAALESTAGSGAVAARAAERLLCLEALDTRDARLDTVLNHAPLLDAVELAGAILYFDANFSRVSHIVLEALCSSDEDLADAGVRAVSIIRDQRDIWREALQRGVHSSIKDYALRQAGLPSQAEQYWLDEIDEDDRLAEAEMQPAP